MTTEANSTATVEAFEIRAGLNGTDRDQWGTIASFDTGKEAAAHLAEIRATYTEQGKSLAIVKVAKEAPAVDWRERERSRLEDGSYSLLDDVITLDDRNPCQPCCYQAGDEWHEKTVQDLFNHYAPDAFAHRSDSDRRKIAYIASEANGIADRQTRVNAGIAFERLLSAAPARVRNAALAAIMGDAVPLFVTTTPEEMVEAYVRCNARAYVSSCMSYPTRQYSTGGVHPVEVYAKGGDLALAYITENGEQDGPIAARALVWPEKKAVGRIYAYNTGQFCNVLRANGYTTNGSSYGEALIGARLAKIEAGSDSTYIMPYIDGDQSFSDHEDEAYFAVGGGEYEANRTDGLAHITERAYCEHCDEYQPVDDFREVDGEIICGSCASGASVCECCDGYTFNRTSTHRETGWNRRRDRDYRVCNECLEEHFVNVSGTWLHTDLVIHCDDCSEPFDSDDIDHNSRCEDCAENAEQDEDSQPAPRCDLTTSLPLTLADCAPQPQAIDWTQPIEYVDGSPARLNPTLSATPYRCVSPHGEPEACVGGNHYNEDGTHAYGRHMAVRNVAQIEATYAELAA